MVAGPRRCVPSARQAATPWWHGLRRWLALPSSSAAALSPSTLPALWRRPGQPVPRGPSPRHAAAGRRTVRVRAAAAARRHAGHPDGVGASHLKWPRCLGIVHEVSFWPVPALPRLPATSCKLGSRAEKPLVSCGEHAAPPPPACAPRFPLRRRVLQYTVAAGAAHAAAHSGACPLARAGRPAFPSGAADGHAAARRGNGGPQR